MDKLEMFLKRQDEILNDDREKILIALGLTKKEYAPDGKKNYLYTEREYNDGNEKYYRYVAMDVTDEEWELILEKISIISNNKELKLQTGAERKVEPRTHFVGKWVPLFKKYETYGVKEEEKKESGYSGMASFLRWFAFSMILVVIVLLGIGLFDIPLLLTVIGFVLMFGMASILDYLAEIRAIAREGYKYKE